MDDIIILSLLLYLAIRSTPYMVYLLYDAEIMDSPRTLVKRIPFVDSLLECVCCTSFWGGMATSLWACASFALYLISAIYAVPLIIPLVAMAGAREIVLEDIKNVLHSSDP